MDNENQVTAYLERSDTGEVTFTTPPARIELKGNVVTFGRGIGNVVIWESLQISRRHAVMEYRNQVWRIKDTSTNGMMVNGRRITQNEFIDLQHMDTIAFVPTGSLQYKFYKVIRSPLKINSLPSMMQGPLIVPSFPLGSVRASSSSSYGDSVQCISPTTHTPSIKSQSPKRKTNTTPSEPSSISAHSDRKRKRLLLNTPHKSEGDDDEEEELLDIDDMPSFFDSHTSIANFSPPANSTGKEEYELDLKSLQGDESSKVRELLRSYRERISELENTNRRVQSEKEKKEKETTELRNKLSTAQSEKRVVEEEQYKKIIEVMDNELACCICNDVFIQATVLNCGHTFCAHCITEWRKRKNECPTCRKEIIALVRHVEMENYITKVYQSDLVSKEMRSRREEIVQDRSKEVENVKALDAAAAAAARVPQPRARARANGNEYPFANGEQFADFLQDLQLHHDIFVPHPHHRRATHHQGNFQVPPNILGYPNFAPFAELARSNPPLGPPGGGPGSRRRSSRINPRVPEAAGPSRGHGVRGRGGHAADGVHPADGLQIHLSRVADFGPMDILTVD